MMNGEQAHNDPADDKRQNLCFAMLCKEDEDKVRTKNGIQQKKNTDNQITIRKVQHDKTIYAQKINFISHDADYDSTGSLCTKDNRRRD